MLKNVTKTFINYLFSKVFIPKIILKRYLLNIKYEIISVPVPNERWTLLQGAIYLLLLTVSQMFMLQQFSMVISHWSPPDGLGRHVRGVTLLLTIIRFLTRGLLRSNSTFLVRTAISSMRTRHSASRAKRMWSRFHSTSSEDTFSISEQLRTGDDKMLYMSSNNNILQSNFISINTSMLKKCVYNLIYTLFS